MFETIENIDIDKPESWGNKLFITSDIDWSSDDVLKYTIDLFNEYEVKVTYFATHKTKILENLRHGSEIGLHPNFNYLLNGDTRYGKNYKEVISYYKQMYPNSVSVRSHSLTQSSFILDEFLKQGLKFDVNGLFPLNNSCLIPFKILINGITKVPFIWEDDVHCHNKAKWDISITDGKGIKVLNFHPIHIFLNTEKMERYSDARPYFKDYLRLKEFVNATNYGTRNFLIDLLRHYKG
ncbi:MAG TPA: hypothetical protein VIK14_09355 [Ignavibacteria bacterium]